MRTFRRCAVFVLLALLMSAGLKFLLVPSSYMRIALHEVQDSKKNYDVIFVGQSHGELAFDPQKIEEKTGMSAYNLARRQIVMRDVYYVVKEADYKNDPKVILYDMDPTYWIDNETPNYYGDSYMYPHLNNPLNKAEYFLRYNTKEDFRMTLFPYWLCGTDDIKKIKTTLSNKLKGAYWNYSIEAVNITNKSVKYHEGGFWYQDVQTNEDFHANPWKDEKVSESARQSFMNMAEYCKKQGIQFICVSSPLPKDRRDKENYHAAHQYMEALTEECEVPYWDFNDADFGIDEKKDFIDKDGHLLGPSAQKYSEYLGQVLAEYMQGKDVNHYFAKEHQKGKKK